MNHSFSTRIELVGSSFDDLVEYGCIVYVLLDLVLVVELVVYGCIVDVLLDLVLFVNQGGNKIDGEDT